MDALYDPVAGLYNLLYSLILICAVIVISVISKLKIEKELLIAVLRAVIQLMAVILVIAAIFESGNMFLVFAALFVMVVFASKISGERAGIIKRPMTVTFPSIASGAGGVIFVLILAGVIPLDPKYLIPIGSMAIGGTMIVCSLVLNRYAAELSSHKGQIEAALSLGAEEGEAVDAYICSSVAASLIPSIDRMKSLGIVILPGSLAGMIIGGVNPVWAAEYQLVIMFMIFSSETLAAIIAVNLLKRRFDVTRL